MAEHYTDFDNIASGENGTIEGLLPLEGSASAFRYKKVIIVVVFVGGFGVSLQDIKGNWKVRLRADASRNLDGSYAGEILFEQEVQWTARVISLSEAGLSLVTWQPLGDGGSGKQMTSICQSQPCAVVTDINDPAQMATYGQTGAWRFLDNSAVHANETPAQKYNIEKGFTLFTDEGVATVGGYQFFADWQSADYLCDIPAGAILETVFDHWQVGTLDDEATYLFSYKAGVTGSDALTDQYGQLWQVASRDGGVEVLTTFSPFYRLNYTSFLPDSREPWLGFDPQGRTYLLIKRGDGWWEYRTENGGYNFTPVRKVFDEGMTMARMLIDKGGRRLTLALDGSELVLNTSSPDESDVLEIGIGTLAQKQAYTPATDAQGRVYAVGEDGTMLLINDGTGWAAGSAQ